MKELPKLYIYIYIYIYIYMYNIYLHINTEHRAEIGVAVQSWL